MNPLNTIKGTIIAGIVIAVVLAILPMTTVGQGGVPALLIWLHVLAGITWIGLLYYFNFVQVPALAEAAGDEGGPGGAGISRYVAPRALLWFRWGAVATWITGASYLAYQGNLIGAFTLGAVPGSGNPAVQLTIGIGAWLGTIMAFNVWVLIWPNQRKILGLVEASAEQISKARRVAFLASRTNTMLSIPMLMSMIGSHHGFLI